MPQQGGHCAALDCPTMLKLWLIPILCLAAGAASAATSCDTLRADIEAKIAAAGVTRFSVTVVAVDAPATGQVVGSCELGSQKIVYTREGAAAAAAEAGASRPPKEPMLTECKDGTVSVGGDCRK